MFTYLSRHPSLRLFFPCECFAIEFSNISFIKTKCFHTSNIGATHTKVKSKFTEILFFSVFDKNCYLIRRLSTYVDQS